jgi:hypothetical protein
MFPKEASVRIKINNRLADSRWSIFNNGQGIPNIVLENLKKINQPENDALEVNFEHLSRIFVNYNLGVTNFPLMRLKLRARNFIHMCEKYKPASMPKIIFLCLFSIDKNNFHI